MRRSSNERKKERKSIAISILGGLLLVVGLYFIKCFTEPQGIMRTLPYILIGVGCGMFGHGIGDILAKRMTAKDPEFARKIAIEEKDERNIMISNMARAKAFNIMTYVFGALMLAYALMGASMEILIPFVIAYLFVQFYALYIRMKKDKEN